MFRILEDGAWHNLKDIAKKIGAPTEELTHYCQNISNHNVIEYDPDSDKVRLSQKLMTMITQLKADEQAEAKWEKKGVGTIIIPPRKEIQIQGIKIHNMTEQDMELKLTFNKKLKEIAVSMI